jgi:hypothetical protein
MQKHACKHRCRPANPVGEHHATARRRTPHPSLATAAICPRPWRQMHRPYCHIGAPRPTRSRVTIAGGRFPGSRVVASGHLPRDPRVSSGIHGRPLAAYSCGGSFGIARPTNCIGRTHRIPLVSPCGHHHGQRRIGPRKRQQEGASRVGSAHAARTSRGPISLDGRIQPVCRALASSGETLTLVRRSLRHVPEQLNNAAIPLCQRGASGYTQQCIGHYLEVFKTTSAAKVAACGRYC